MSSLRECTISVLAENVVALVQITTEDPLFFYYHPMKHTSNRLLLDILTKLLLGEPNGIIEVRHQKMSCYEAMYKHISYNWMDDR